MSFQKFTISYLFAYTLSEGNWHFHGSFCSVGFQKHFTDPWARCTAGPHHPCINLEKRSSHISWITIHSPQVKHSDGVTKVNEHVVRNVILDTNTCNQQLDVQSSLGWDDTSLGFIFCLSPSFIRSFAYCFLYPLWLVINLDQPWVCRRFFSRLDSWEKMQSILLSATPAQNSTIMSGAQVELYSTLLWMHSVIWWHRGQFLTVLLHFSMNISWTRWILLKSYLHPFSSECFLVIRFFNTWSN